MADDRDDLFEDAHGAGRSDGPDRWPTNHEGPQGEVAAPKTGMSGTVKILLILLAVAVIAGILCCGGIVWWFKNNFQQTTNAATVRDWTQEIISIDIPQEFTPSVGAKVNGFGVIQYNLVIYTGPGGGALTIGNIQGQAADDPQAQQQIEQQMQQQGATHQIDPTETEKRTVEIDGQEVEFTFVTGKEAQSGSEWKEVRGTFRGKQGLVILRLQQPADSFDEEAVTQMLQSISTK